MNLEETIDNTTHEHVISRVNCYNAKIGMSYVRESKVKFDSKRQFEKFMIAKELYATDERTEEDIIVDALKDEIHQLKADIVKLESAANTFRTKDFWWLIGGMFAGQLCYNFIIKPLLGW